MGVAWPVKAMKFETLMNNKWSLSEIFYLKLYYIMERIFKSIHEQGKRFSSKSQFRSLDMVKIIDINYYLIRVYVETSVPVRLPKLSTLILVSM